jgi:hypothetical protein
MFQTERLLFVPMTAALIEKAQESEARLGASVSEGLFEPVLL